MKKFNFIWIALLAMGMNNVANARPACTSMGGGVGVLGATNYSSFSNWCCVSSGGQFYGVTIYHGMWDTGMWSSVQIGCNSFRTVPGELPNIDFAAEQVIAEKIVSEKYEDTSL